MQGACRLVNASCATFVSLHLPSWPDDDIKDVVSHFAGVRTLRIVNPLDTGTPDVKLDSNLILPFIPLRTTATSEPSPYALDMLWLVQDADIQNTFADWCEELSLRLQGALVARARARQSDYIQTVKVLRVQFGVVFGLGSEQGRPEQILRTKFTGLAEEIQWETE
ncbi:hypothetical protein PENSPDRAFT_659717 [Peniophora sp. CONT]|nr:hypothetical protein PENSPDRAFT_659717 [Peniophora sp. CONT]